MRSNRLVVEWLVYGMLFAILISSIIGFIWRTSWFNAWEIYSHIYLGLLLLYTWFTFVLLFIGEKQKNKPVSRLHSSREPKVAVIIPCFNEPPQLLYKSIRSVIQAEGNKQIIVVDDGSSNPRSRHLLEVFAKRTDVQVHFFKYNQGKRHAIYHAVKHMVKDVDFIVTIDSDTVLDRNAIVRLIEKFDDPRVGAVTGDVRLLNEKRNLLTRMVGAYYWIGLNIYKKAQSAAGMVVCCSGCLSGYRAELLSDVIDEFVRQKFFGEKCTHSEDRHLTNLILKRRHHIKFVPEAICYTETPATIPSFLKQQQRWKRGFIRESIFTLTYAWKTRPLLFFQILLWDLTIPFFSFGLVLALFVSVIADPTFLALILPAWIGFVFVRYLPILFYGKRKVPGLFIYMFFYEIFLYWQSIYALFTVRNKSWITRSLLRAK